MWRRAATIIWILAGTGLLIAGGWRLAADVDHESDLPCRGPALAVWADPSRAEVSERLRDDCANAAEIQSLDALALLVAPDIVIVAVPPLRRWQLRRQRREWAEAARTGVWRLPVSSRLFAWCSFVAFALATVVLLAVGLTTEAMFVAPLVIFGGAYVAVAQRARLEIGASITVVNGLGVHQVRPATS